MTCTRVAVGPALFDPELRPETKFFVKIFSFAQSRDPFEADSAHCPAMYTGPGCRQEKFLPDCTGTVKPFQGYLTMTVGNPWPGIDDETRAMLPERVRQATAHASAELSLQSSLFVAAAPGALLAQQSSTTADGPTRFRQDVFGRPPGSRAAIPSCALVSNGNMIKGKGLGREIDSHNLVMRINNAPVTGYEVRRRLSVTILSPPLPQSALRPTCRSETSDLMINHHCRSLSASFSFSSVHAFAPRRILPLKPPHHSRPHHTPTRCVRQHDVGARTDVRFSNANYEGWRETPTEAVIAEHWNILEWERAAGDMRNFTAAAGAQLKRVLAKKVHPLNHEIYNTLASSHFFHDERDTHVTGGFVAMVRQDNGGKEKRERETQAAAQLAMRARERRGREKRSLA